MVCLKTKETKTHLLVDETLPFLSFNFSNLQSLPLDRVEIGIFLSGFALQMNRKGAGVLELDFTLIDAARMSPTHVPNQNATAKGRRG